MDARIIKTKKKIKEALLSVLQTKPLNDVSISELCKKANVNRNTFYAHYATPQDALTDAATEYLSEEYELLNRCSTTKQLVITACTYIKDHATETLIFLKNNSALPFEKIGIEYSKKAPFYLIDNHDGSLSPDLVQMIHTYIVYGAVAIIKEWLYRGMKESPEELGEKVDLITTCLINGINQCKNQML